MKPIVRYEIIVIHHDLTTTGSSNKTGAQGLSGGTQQLIESGSDIKAIYQIPHFSLRKQRKNLKKSSVERN